MDLDIGKLTSSLEATVLGLINFREPVPLAEVAAHAHTFGTWGVYLISEGHPEAVVEGGLPKNVIYIGKGIGEGIAGRSAKHLANMTCAVNAEGRLRIKTSRAIRAYRERVGHDVNDLWFSAAPMDGVNGSVVSFAEEVLLEQYVRAHGRLPVCNTAGGHLWKPAASWAVASPGKRVAPPRRAPVAEDDELEILCASIATRLGLVSKRVIKDGYEARIALGEGQGGTLAGVAVRAGFKARARDVVVSSVLQPAAAIEWGEPKPHAQPNAMKSVVRMSWPLEMEKFERLVLAAVEEVKTKNRR